MAIYVNKSSYAFEKRSWLSINVFDKSFEKRDKVLILVKLSIDNLLYILQE